jgi:phosphoglucosamine mutase
LGGEQSGHLLFLDSSTTGDAIIACLKVLEMMCHTGKTISQLTSAMKKFPQITKSIKISSKPPLHSLKKTSLAIKKFEQKLGSAGRILLRYSGTESLVRLTVEGPQLEQIQNMAQKIENLLLREIG